MKLAREATGRPMILGFLGQYHGEATYLTAAGSTDLSEVTSNSAQYVSGLVFAPYPNQFRAPFHKGPGPYDDTIYVDYLEEVLLRHQVDPEQVAGVLIEPVLGEGGIVIPSADFWKRLDALCQRYGWVMIADEVQTGIGRCGTMFAVERWDLEPELILLAKGFAGGVMPIGGTLGSERVMANATSHVGATFGWPPAASVAALRTSTHPARRRARQRPGDGAGRLEVLGPLVDRFEQVGDVRAAGGLVGVEFVTDMETISAGAEVPARRPPRRPAARGARDHPGGQVGLSAAAGAQPADRALPLVVRAGRRGGRGGQRRPPGRVAGVGRGHRLVPARRLRRPALGAAGRAAARDGLGRVAARGRP